MTWRQGEGQVPILYILSIHVKNQPKLTPLGPKAIISRTLIGGQGIA